MLAATVAHLMQCHVRIMTCNAPHILSSGALDACLLQPPDCDASAGECGSWVVYPYFISFVLLVSVIMLNLFTAVILESFEAQQEQDVGDSRSRQHWLILG